MDAHALAAVVPVPGKSDTFVLLGNDRAATLKLDCNDKACVLRRAPAQRGEYRAGKTRANISWLRPISSNTLPVRDVAARLL